LLWREGWAVVVVVHGEIALAVYAVPSTVEKYKRIGSETQVAVGIGDGLI